MYFIRRQVTDVTQAMLSLTLALGLNGLLTDIMKLTVGKSTYIKVYLKVK